MLTRKGWTNILSRIMETGGMTEDMEREVEALRAELDEREGMLKRYGENYDGENEELESYEYRGRNDEEWERKYNDLAARYRSRMFGGSREDKTVLQIGDKAEEKEEDEPRRLTMEEILY